MIKYERTGVLSLKDLLLPSKKQLEKGVAIAECIQEIPCNPCVDSCPVNAISMKDINAPPVVDYDRCIACTKCVGICPGLAIFVIKQTGDNALVTLPYEMIPVPEKLQTVDVLNRKGEKIDTGMVKKIVYQGKTAVVTIEVKKEHIMHARNIKV